GDWGRARHWSRGMTSWRRQVPKREARVILIVVPVGDWVPPLILRLVARWRRLRSAALLVGGTRGLATNTNSSLRWRSMRRDRVPWTASGSWRNGRQRV